MGRRICNEVERVCHTFDTLQAEFQQRYQNSKKLGETEIQRTQTWLCEAVKQNGYELYENCINMLEAAVYHHEDAENKYAELGVQTSENAHKMTSDYSPVKKQAQPAISSRSGS